MKYAAITAELRNRGETLTEGAQPLPSDGGMMLAAAYALNDLDERLSLALKNRFDVGEDEAPAPSKGKGKAAGKPAAGGERKRAARGLPPCKMGGRHTWNLQGWCSKCGEVHRDGKIQAELPGASAPPVEGAS